MTSAAVVGRRSPVGCEICKSKWLSNGTVADRIRRPMNEPVRLFRSGPRKVALIWPPAASFDLLYPPPSASASPGQDPEGHAQANPTPLPADAPQVFRCQGRERLGRRRFNLILRTWPLFMPKLDFLASQPARFCWQHKESEANRIATNLWQIV